MCLFCSGAYILMVSSQPDFLSQLLQQVWILYTEDAPIADENIRKSLYLATRFAVYVMMVGFVLGLFVLKRPWVDLVFFYVEAV